MTGFRSVRADTERGALRTLRSLVDSAEALLEGISEQQGPAIDELRSRAKSTLNEARDRLAMLKPARDRLQSQTVRAAGRFIRRDPWRAVAVASLVVLAVGVFVLGSGDQPGDL
ncbi:MAG: DUF883 family protein [Gammaproteobacteria bacterium]